MIPVKLSPAFKDYLWGGTKLKTVFNKKTDLEKVAESWELSVHPDGESVISSGECMGKTLSEFIKTYDCLGENAKRFDFFPILIKFIDALGNLSVQVHPDDEYSLAHNGEYGKTEVWYILDCEPGATLYYGFKHEITRDEFRKRIKENTLLEVLNKVSVKKGDVFFIESGTVHAIGAGILICEIQQNSNTTYRVYDYNRKDKDGNTRPLHIEEAIAVSNLTQPKKQDNLPENTIAKCKYFTVEKYDVKDEFSFDVTKLCFKSLIVTEGDGTLLGDGFEIKMNKGDSLFIPADTGKCTVKGNCEIIISYV